MQLKTLEKLQNIDQELKRFNEEADLTQKQIIEELELELNKGKHPYTIIVELDECSETSPLHQDFDIYLDIPNAFGNPHYVTCTTANFLLKAKNYKDGDADWPDMSYKDYIKYIKNKCKNFYQELLDN